MSETPPKADILLALRKTLADELATLERVAAMSRDEAISEETRSENDFDTRATEASLCVLICGRKARPFVVM